MCQKSKILICLQRQVSIFRIHLPTKPTVPCRCSDRLTTGISTQGVYSSACSPIRMYKIGDTNFTLQTAMLINCIYNITYIKLCIKLNKLPVNFKEFLHKIISFVGNWATSGHKELTLTGKETEILEPFSVICCRRSAIL